MSGKRAFPLFPRKLTLFYIIPSLKELPSLPMIVATNVLFLMKIILSCYKLTCVTYLTFVLVGRRNISSDLRLWGVFLWDDCLILKFLHIIVDNAKVLLIDSQTHPICKDILKVRAFLLRRLLVYLHKLDIFND